MANVLNLGVAAAAAIMLLSCGEERKSGKNADTASPLEKIELEGYSYDRISEFLTPDSTGMEGAQYWRSIGQGVLPGEINGKPVPALRDTLESLGSVVFTGPGDAEPRINEKERKLTDLSPATTDPCSYSYNTVNMTLMTTTVAVWKNYAAYYACGAAHGRYATRYVNYSIADGEILSLHDLFRPGYEPVLLKKLKDKLKGNPDIFPDAEITIPDVFAVTSEGVTFLYGLYDIAPYSSGEIAVSFDSFELTDILSSKGTRLILGAQSE